MPADMSQPTARSYPLSTARYRVYQVWRSLAARPLDAEDHAILDATLPAAGRAVFFTMSRNDQRHSLTVYRALRERGCDDADLLAAALLHDSGKGGGRVPFVIRPAVVLLRAFAPGALRWLARSPPAIRGFAAPSTTPGATRISARTSPRRLVYRRAS